ncbi:hypothetical protein HispidOSU_012161, partial [Sigmodon hispidus]
SLGTGVIPFTLLASRLRIAHLIAKLEGKSNRGEKVSRNRKAKERIRQKSSHSPGPVTPSRQQ